ncbi:MAG: hypothetical protein ABIG63_09235 [Chloroflexota bacterium]
MANNYTDNLAFWIGEADGGWRMANGEWQMASIVLLCRIFIIR